MADGFDLSHDDYKDFIKYCEGSKSGFGIIEYINVRIKKYIKDNPDFITTLMEHIETMYPKIENDYEDENGYVNENRFYKQDILNFRKECKGIDRPELKFLYSYLCSLSADEKKFRRVSGLKEELPSDNPNRNSYTEYEKMSKEMGKIIDELPKVDQFNSFKTICGTDRLNEIFVFLTEKGFLESRSRESFIAIFSNRPLGEIKPIRWLSNYTSGADMISLFELIKYLCKWEYLKPSLQDNFFDKISKCFKRSDNSIITKSAVEARYHKWINLDPTEKLLDSKYNNKQVCLVKFLHSPSK